MRDARSRFALKELKSGHLTTGMLVFQRLACPFPSAPFPCRVARLVPLPRRYVVQRSESRIFTKNPDRPILAKLTEVAGLLGARVQGDNGEFYNRQ